MTALFGAIFGLATVTTVIALLIQSVPPTDDRELLTSTSAPLTPEGGSVEEANEPTARKPTKRVRQKVEGPWRISALESDANIRIVSQEVDRRAFVKAMQEAGVDKAQVYRVLKAFEGHRKFDKTQRRDRFIAAIDKQSKLLKAFEYVVSPLEVWQARENAAGLLEATRLDMLVAEEEVQGAYYVDKSLARSIEWSLFEPGIEKALDEAFEGHTSTDSFEEGGTVRAIVMERTALGDFAGYASVIAAEYRPPDPEKSAIRVYSFQGEKSRGYFDARGRQPDGGGWAHPVPGAPITSRFNPKRMHPILKKVTPHNGTDYGAPTGTPVYAAFRGTVTWIGPRGAAGNLVLIDHPNGVETGYYHLSRFAAGLKVGQKVGSQQVIGYVGSTGRSTGPHLHFAAKRGGAFFDAETLRMASFRVVHVDDRARFSQRKAELDARLDALPLPEPPPPEPAAEVANVVATATAADAAAKVEPKPGGAEAGDPGPSGESETAAAPEAPADGAARKPEPGGDADLEDLIGPDLR